MHDCLACISICMCATHTWCPRRSKGGTRSFAIGVREGSELPRRCQELNLGLCKSSWCSQLLRPSHSSSTNFLALLHKFYLSLQGRITSTSFTVWRVCCPRQMNKSRILLRNSYSVITLYGKSELRVYSQPVTCKHCNLD